MPKRTQTRRKKRLKRTWKEGGLNHWPANLRLTTVRACVSVCVFLCQDKPCFCAQQCRLTGWMCVTFVAQVCMGMCVCVFVWAAFQPCELGMDVMSLPLIPPQCVCGYGVSALPDPNLLAFIGLLSKKNTPNSQLIFNKQKLDKKKKNNMKKIRKLGPNGTNTFCVHTVRLKHCLWCALNTKGINHRQQWLAMFFFFKQKFKL